MIANEAYLSAITDKHFSEFYLQDGGKNQLRYGTIIISLSPCVLTDLMSNELFLFVAVFKTWSGDVALCVV